MPHGGCTAGMGYLQALLAAHNGSIQESLEDVVRTIVGRGKQLLYAFGSLGSAARLVIHDAQGIAFAVHTVHRSADIQRKYSGRSVYLQGFRYFLFHAFHTEKGRTAGRCGAIAVDRMRLL